VRHTAAEKYKVIRLVEGSDLPARQTLRELQVNRATFYRWYARYRQLRRTIREAGPLPKGTIAFVPSDHTGANGLFGPDSLLLALRDRDPQFDDRALPCTRAILKRRTKIHCYFASIGHPNRKGVTRYLNGLKQAAM
jgi:hypothetical protein